MAGRDCVRLRELRRPAPGSAAGILGAAGELLPAHGSFSARVYVQTGGRGRFRRARGARLGNAQGAGIPRTSPSSWCPTDQRGHKANWEGCERHDQIAELHRLCPPLFRVRLRGYTAPSELLTAILGAYCIFPSENKPHMATAPLPPRIGIRAAQGARCRSEVAIPAGCPLLT